MHSLQPIRLTTAALLLVAASISGQAQQCESWQRVDTPSPGAERNYFVDAEEANGTVYALMFSTDSPQVRPPGEYHVLRRDGNTWTDLGGPDDEALGPFVTEYQALGVAPDGTLYVGGWFFPLSIGRDPAPAMASVTAVVAGIRRRKSRSRTRWSNRLGAARHRSGLSRSRPTAR